MQEVIVAMRASIDASAIGQQRASRGDQRKNSDRHHLGQHKRSTLTSKENAARGPHEVSEREGFTNPRAPT